MRLRRLNVWDDRPMIDDFALAISHGLMLLTAILLLRRRDLDDERPEPPKKPLRRQ